MDGSLYAAPDGGPFGWDLAHCYGLPTFGMAGASDAKVFDAQAASLKGARRDQVVEIRLVRLERRAAQKAEDVHRPPGPPPRATPDGV